MPYDVKKDTITVNDVTYDVKREPDRGSPEETLTLRVYDMETDEFIDPFPGLSATLGMEECVEEWMSPRDWSNVGTMAVSYRGYSLGDEDISQIDFEIKCDKCDGSGETDDWVVGFHNTAERLVVGSYDDCQEWLSARLDVLTGSYYIEPIGCPKCECSGVIEVNPVDYFKQERGARVVIGLTVYEHSGITMRAGDVTLPFDSDRWDTSFVGFIFDTPEQLKDTMGDDVTDEQIEAALRDEVKVYADYLEGDVSFYSVQDDETNFQDSCGGYVGAQEQCQDECFSALEDAVEKRLAEIKERAYWNARGTETV